MTLEALVVRPARPQDAAEVRRLSMSFTPDAQEVPPEAFHSRFTQFVADASWCLPVAQARGRLIGYGLAQDFGPGLRATFTTGRVHDVFVDPDTRLGGTGRALMNFIFDWSRARPQPMILDWQASPSAIGFYEALGFTADRVGDFPEYPGFTLDLRQQGALAPGALNSAGSAQITFHGYHHNTGLPLVRSPKHFEGVN